jgi:hypothetical protein
VPRPDSFPLFQCPLYLDPSLQTAVASPSVSVFFQLPSILGSGGRRYDRNFLRILPILAKKPIIKNTSKN